MRRAQEVLNDNMKPPRWVTETRKLIRCVQCGTQFEVKPGSIRRHFESCRDPLGEP